MDYDYGFASEMLYEYTTGAKNDYNVRFSSSAMDNVREAEYIDSCISSVNLFGCIGVKNKENIILNKKYEKDEFKKLREKIIEQMNENPFINKNNIIYKYGDFLLLPFLL